MGLLSPPLLPIPPHEGEAGLFGRGIRAEGAAVRNECALYRALKLYPSHPSIMQMSPSLPAVRSANAAR